jgi:transcriptional regulator with XRE-family HTH domain
MNGDDVPHKTLREWRTSKFLTQEELAAKVGVTFYTISNWELGIKQPRFKNLRALAAALDIQPEQIVLVQGKGNPVAAA